MYKVFDYICEACSIVEERMVDNHEEDNQKCLQCEDYMSKEMPGPRGKVLGSHTPVKQ